MKKLLIPITFIILLVIAGAFLFKKTPKKEIPITPPTTLFPTTPALPETNPFKADVNPYNSYNNPFK